MQTASTAALASPSLEDPLDYLPRVTVQTFKKGKYVYSQNELAISLYVVISGRVKLSRLTETGGRTMMDVCVTDDFFGESALLGNGERREEAVAVENTTVMSWTAEEIEEIMERKPKLAIALLHLCVKRAIHLEQRIETFSEDGISRRLARALLYFCAKMGTHHADGSVRLAAFTHETLSQYVGTSREIITGYMIQFRRQGYLEYSRDGILVHPQAMQQGLAQGKSRKSQELSDIAAFVPSCN